MKYIPTTNEPKELKKVYKEVYGDTAYFYRHDLYELMEFMLLNDAYKEKFNNEGVGLFFFSPSSLLKINTKIRDCLATGIPYKYPDLPKGAII